MDACTIIAKNYVAQARVLARSFLEHHPGGRFWTLVIDEFTDYLDPASEPFETLTPADVGCDPFMDMAFRYSVLELSTAVKPWLLGHLMSEVDGPVTYLDPDIQVFDSLGHLEDLAREHELVLTPHCTEPIPDDGRRPTQIDIMIAGIYNLGYVTLAPCPETAQLLQWWKERLRRDCRVDPVYGYFVDQRWFDLTPGLMSDPAIVREPEYNVAYWNLPSRELAREGDSYTVNGRPLAFFHYSGFDPDEPGVLSRHQNRVSVEDGSVLAEILSQYAALAAREGYGTARNFPYSYDALPDGTPLDPVVRQMFAEAEETGELSVSPLSQEGADAFIAWLSAQSPGAPPGVHRLLARLYGIRQDLRDAFPDVAGADLGRLFAWARGDGAREVPMLAKLPTPEGEGSGRLETTEEAAAPSWGVNVVGHFRSELGIGEAARQVVTALDAAAVPALAVAGTTRPLSRQGHAFAATDHGSSRFPINLICVNADMLPDFAAKAGPEFFAGRHSIGLWFWEVSVFREEWHRSFELVDEVWAPSAHIAAALTPVSPIPVVPVRIPVEMPAIAPRTRADLGLPEGRLFLFSFDYLSVFERKNPLGLLRAFTDAFDPGDGAALVVKCINADRDPSNHARLLAAAAARPDVHVMDRYLDPADKDALTALCDCYVSLHRSEGFGLTMAEAMYLGKPVIGTRYSGNLDFMTDENSLLVDCEMRPVGPGHPPYPADAEWAEPDCEHAARLMRHVFDAPAAADALGARASAAIRQTHSPEAAGEIMRTRLENVRLAPGSPAAERRGAVTTSLARRVGRGPEQGSSRGGVNALARRGALRVMRPYTAYQETVNDEVVRSLAALDRGVLGLVEQEMQNRAALQAQLRAIDRYSTLPEVIAARAETLDELKDTVSLLGGRLDGIEKSAKEAAWETDRGLYTAIALLRERYARMPAKPSERTRGELLTSFELRLFSQNGEDGVIAEILTRIGSGACTFVEFGVESGAEGNCVSLADLLGWQGLFIDCDEVFYPELARKYRGNPRVSTRQAMVTPENVEELFAAAGVPPEPDILSIDVDGADYWIWEALEAHRPRVVVIEYNSAIDPRRRLVQPRDHPGWDGTDFFGASLGAMRSLGERKGYRLVHTELSGVNAFFVREDLADGRFAPADEVIVRGFPNYFQQRYSHPADREQRRYLDLDTGELVDGADDDSDRDRTR
ncbi:MAG TPA: glycosyltransferase [Solirubrobacteraceae bacterium]|jgi:glycosyltransferase involved in cell wall biosynthesis|nr:glycosyltransferase [Solirubrobacteraceae bacterium]